MPAILFLSAAALAAGQETRFGPGGANKVEAVVEKTGLLSGKKHVLAWEKYSGKFSLNPPRVELEVDAGSVRVLDDWINDGKKEDVRKETVGKDVLDVKKFPQIKFASTSVSGDTATAFTVNGTLTVRGIAKPVTIAVKRSGNRYEGETRFPMTGFGIKPPKALLGAIGTTDEMTIRFVVESSQ